MTRSPSVHVAVIARPQARLDTCLWALERAGVPGPQVVRVREPAGGVADARNRALAACRADVLALVEDDVVVAPAWFEALVAAWSSADADALGCVGGPLRATFPQARPSWLGDDLLGAFALIEADGPARVLPPAERTFHGANVSFRAAALRGVGGFWPARGHEHARDWFSEEHHAQHELGRAGWAAWLQPGMAAGRVIPAGVRRRDVLRRRLRYGARFTLTGEQRRPAIVARSIVTGVAGAPIALARRDAAQAMSRFARAAENLGVALGPLVAHADLQPVARRAPFVDSVPAPAPHPVAAALRRQRPRRNRSAADRRALVLLYHRVVETPDDPLGLAVTPAHFAEQLAALRDHHPIVPLDDVTAGTAPDGAVAITFDDGYADNLRHALPELQAAGVPATLFVSTGHVAEQRGFWWDTAARVLATAARDDTPLRARLGDDERAWPTRSPTAAKHLHAWLQAKPPEDIDHVLRALAGPQQDDALEPPDRDRPLTRDELAELATAGPFAIGAHTRTHRSLAWSPVTTQREELAGSADDLARWLGVQPRAVSYPFGIAGMDVDRTTQRLARELGFSCALVNAAGLVTAATDRFALPRQHVPDVDGATFASWLRRRFGR